MKTGNCSATLRIQWVKIDFDCLLPFEGHYRGLQMQFLWFLGSLTLYLFFLKNEAHSILVRVSFPGGIY